MAEDFFFCNFKKTRERVHEECGAKHWGGRKAGTGETCMREAAGMRVRNRAHMPCAFAQGPYQRILGADVRRGSASASNLRGFCAGE